MPKLFIINNKGYAMVQQTEGEWLNNENYGTSSKDLSFPNFKLFVIIILCIGL